MDWETRVASYLAANKGSLRFATIDEIVDEIKRNVLSAGGVEDRQIRLVVARWAIANQVWLLPEPLNTGDPLGADPKPLSAAHSSELVDSVKKAVGAIADGVTLSRGAGSVMVKVNGLTTKLQGVDSSVALKISWFGTLQLKAQSGPFHFTGELSKDSWMLQLNLPDDDAVPNLQSLPRVFSAGEKAIRSVAAVTKDFPNLPDVNTISALVKPHVAALEHTIDAVSGIPPATKKSGKSFGFRIGSPDPMPGEEGMPRGVQGTVTFTYWW